jgi:L-threonylcarbamoyladenylate synthase
MKIMKTKLINVKDKQCMREAIRVLKKGGVVIYPTETSYGIGADFSSGKARKKVYSIKGRGKEKKLSVIVSNLAMISKIATIDEDAQALIRKFMPGPLTLVVKAKRGTIAFRIPSNKFALTLTERFGKPITATSANISGKPQIYEIIKIIQTFNGKVDLVVDAGDLKKKKPSTIYDVVNKKLLRRGPVKLEDLKKYLRNA